MDLKVTLLLLDVHSILGINWLQAVNPLIDWRSSLLFLPKQAGPSVLPCDWLDQAHKTGTIKVLQDAADLAALRETETERHISVLQTPKF